MSDRFGITGNYLIHSAKGTTWSNHKYLKKVGNKYIYDAQKHADDFHSGKAGSYEDMKKAAGSNLYEVLSKVNSKFKKPNGSKSSSKSSNKTDNSSDTSKNKKSTKDNTQTKEIKDIKTSVKEAISISDNDSIYSTKNGDGTTTVTIKYEDGYTQTLILNNENKVILKSNKEKKQEK